MGVNVQLRLRHLLAYLLQRGLQGFISLQGLAIPKHGVAGCHVQPYLDRWHGRGLDTHYRSVEVDRVQLRGNSDDEHDEQDQHHVDQRRSVDLHHHLGGIAALGGANVNGHGVVVLCVFRLVAGVSHKANLGNACSAQRGHNLAYGLKVGTTVAAYLHFGLGLLLG